MNDKKKFMLILLLMSIIFFTVLTLLYVWSDRAVCFELQENNPILKFNCLLKKSEKEDKTNNPVTDMPKRDEHVFTRPILWIFENNDGQRLELDPDPKVVVNCDMQANSSSFRKCFDYEYDYCGLNPHLSQEDSIQCELSTIAACANVNGREIMYNCSRGGGEGGKKYT
ncbi:hypothetical protein CDIK_0316 [Cucumispora dikerogammari]|nr:hypothetical protein CDIK_0316 [Cucumispora dikerogammari]